MLYPADKVTFSTLYIAWLNIHIGMFTIWSAEPSGDNKLLPSSVEHLQKWKQKKTQYSRDRNVP